jgi:hypothetical protein
MGKSVDNLDYDQHYAEYARAFGIANQESELYVRKRAQETHIHHVHDALRDELAASVTFAQGLSDQQARHFALYGVGRRYGILWSAFRSILEVVRIDRTTPLTGDEGRAVSRDLNTIYINTVGVIDNYAWILRHEKGSADIRALAANRVGLFAKAFLKDPCFAPLMLLLNPFKAWFNELRSRRDPAAHQIPPYVPPTVLDPENLQRYQQIEGQMAALTPLQEFSRIDELRDEQERLGVFVGKFMHHPDEPLIPFYPTIPQDLAQLIRISSAVRQSIGSGPPAPAQCAPQFASTAVFKGGHRK